MEELDADGWIKQMQDFFVQEIRVNPKVSTEFEQIMELLHNFKTQTGSFSELYQSVLKPKP